MQNKTCEQYKHYAPFFHNWMLHDWTVAPCDSCCTYFEPKPTTGDKIRQMNNEGLAAFVCGLLNDRREETFRSVLDLLNAPAESDRKE